MGIGNLGITEMAVIFIIALIVFGPRKLPELGRSLGSAMREFRRSINEIQREIEDADPVRNVRNEIRSLRDDTRSILGPDADRPSRRAPAEAPAAEVETGEPRNEEAQAGGAEARETTTPGNSSD